MITDPRGEQAVADEPVELEIRRVRPDEFDELDEMLEAAYTNDYGPSEQSEDPLRASRARSEIYDVWIAKDPAGRVLGSVTTRKLGGPYLHEDAADDELDLRLLGVSPSARRKGVAAAIMRRIIEEAETVGFVAVVLKTQPKMHGAHRLYESLGFVRTPERDGLWIGGEKVLDLLSYRYDTAS